MLYDALLFFRYLLYYFVVAVRTLSVVGVLFSFFGNLLMVIVSSQHTTTYNHRKLGKNEMCQKINDENKALEL